MIYRNGGNIDKEKPRRQLNATHKIMTFLPLSLLLLVAVHCNLLVQGLLLNYPLYPTFYSTRLSSSSIHQDEQGNCVFGKKDYWDEMYGGSDESSSQRLVTDADYYPRDAYSWYCGWEELSPFWRMLVPDTRCRIVIAGIGNDITPVNMYDDGYTNMMAYDYSRQGVNRARELFGIDRCSDVELVTAEATNLPVNASSVHVTLDKGTLDAIYITGKDIFKDSVEEMTRYTAPEGRVVSISRVIDPDVLLEAFDNQYWENVHDGTLSFATDGEATIDLGAEFYSWKRTDVPFKQSTIEQHDNDDTSDEDQSTIEKISVTLSQEWSTSTSSWSKKAADILKKYGVVALQSQSNNANGLICQDICNNANEAISSRVEDMHRRIESRGLDPTGTDEPYRFAEIISRDSGGRRYDVPVPWLAKKEQDNEDRGCGTPLDASQEKSISKLHSSMHEVVTSVTDELWEHTGVTAAGFMVNRPGSSSQNWHRDGPDEGYIDCFVPLIDLDDSLGPTALQPGSHIDESTVQDREGLDVEVVSPLLRKGDMLLFDYRTIHRGLGNKSKDTTRTVAYAVFKRKESESCNDVGDIRNFPSALTLEYD